MKSTFIDIVSFAPLIEAFEKVNIIPANISYIVDEEVTEKVYDPLKVVQYYAQEKGLDYSPTPQVAIEAFVNSLSKKEGTYYSLIPSFTPREDKEGGFDLEVNICLISINQWSDTGLENLLSSILYEQDFKNLNYPFKSAYYPKEKCYKLLDSTEKPLAQFYSNKTYCWAIINKIT